MTEIPTDTEESPRERRLRQVRESKARYDARLAQMTKLEQCAFQERAELGEAYNPYTRMERLKMEQLKAEIERITRDAQKLNEEITARLKREAGTEPVKEKLLARFCTISTLRLEIPPF